MAEKYVDDPILMLLAKTNLRKLSLSDIVSDIQECQDNLELLSIDPLAAIGFQRPQDCPESEWIDSHRRVWQFQIDARVKELERRRNVQNTYIINPDREIIQTIKERIKIEDVVEWYTQVFYEKRVWKYRCTLHGEDRTPSGIIYPDEKRVHCFGCNRGGDIFDVVQWFERTTIQEAIKKLANHCGIDLKPLKKKQDIIRGGTPL